jgi:hypothetical protein
VWCQQTREQPQKNFMTREQRAEYNKHYRKRCAAKEKAYRNTPERQLAEMTDNLRQYGITFDEYKVMWIEQGGCCGICGKHQNEFDKALGVDHCHSSNKVRGLLCKSCNLAIGHLKDDVMLLDKAKEYLLRFRN